MYENFKNKIYTMHYDMNIFLAKGEEIRKFFDNCKVQSNTIHPKVQVPFKIYQFLRQ